MLGAIALRQPHLQKGNSTREYWGNYKKVMTKALAVMAIVSVCFAIALIVYMRTRRSLMNYRGMAWRVSDGSDSLSLTSMSRGMFLGLMGDAHRRQVHVLPRYTVTGCLCTRVPPDVKKSIVSEYHRKRSNADVSPETDAALVEFDSEEKRPCMTWVTGSDAEITLRSWLSSALSLWCGVPHLDHTATYGVRTYRRGSKLTPHTDRHLTHAISAIIHIEKKMLVKDWPLEILPHDAPHVHQVFLSDEMDCLFYESATVPHGRLEPLDADEYSNLFVHFRPPGWSADASLLMGD